MWQQVKRYRTETSLGYFIRVAFEVSFLVFLEAKSYLHNYLITFNKGGYHVFQVACPFTVKAQTVKSQVHSNPQIEAKMSCDFYWWIQLHVMFRVLHSDFRLQAT